jgi:hypothetical protein
VGAPARLGKYEVTEGAAQFLPENPRHLTGTHPGRILAAGKPAAARSGA